MNTTTTEGARITTAAALAKIDAIAPGAGLYFEAMCFGLARQHLAGYDGGDWRAAARDGLAFYIPPPQSEPVALECPGMQRIAHTDAVTAGAAISLAAVNHACWYFHHKGAIEKAEALTELYHSMRAAFLDDASPFDTATIAAYID